MRPFPNQFPGRGSKGSATGKFPRLDILSVAFRVAPCDRFTKAFFPFPFPIVYDKELTSHALQTRGFRECVSQDFIAVAFLPADAKFNTSNRPSYNQKVVESKTISLQSPNFYVVSQPRKVINSIHATHLTKVVYR